MSNDSRIQLFLDRQEIMELSWKYSRACDRLDTDLLSQVYWPDGTDDHGIFKGTAPEYVEWVMGLLKQWTSSHQTNSNFLIDVDGDIATGEVHWTGFYRYVIDGQPMDQLAAGRYLDKYERRNGEWRILHRTCTSEWSRVEKVEEDWRADPGPSIMGVRDKSDPVYDLINIGIS